MEEKSPRGTRMPWKDHESGLKVRTIRAGTVLDHQSWDGSDLRVIDDGTQKMW